MSITLVLADDHPVLLNGLASVLQHEEDFEVVASCGDGEEALEAIRLHRPSVALLDIRMPKLNGLEVARMVREERLPTRSVLLSAAVDEEETVEALRAGVVGILLKGMAVPQMIQCIRKVNAGEQWLEHSRAMMALEKIVRRDSGEAELRSLLTPREMEVVLMVTRGLRNKEIAHKLCVSEGTVKVHLHNIYEKLKIDGRLALWRHAQEKGVV